MTSPTKPRNNWGQRRFARLAHFGWLWCLVAFVVVNGFIRNRTVAIAALGIVVGALAILGMIRTCDRGHLVAWRREDPLLALAGAFGTGSAVRLLDLPPVLAVAATGVAGGLLVRRIAGAEDYHAAPIYCGAFAAGTSIEVLGSPWWILLAGLIVGVFWSVSREAWAGIGGKMGTVALMGVLVTVGLAWSVHRLGPGATPLHSRGAIAGVLVCAVLSAGTTWWLAYRREWSVVLASAVPTALVALVLYWIPYLSPDTTMVLDVAWLGASFVGMTSPARLPRPVLVVPLAGGVYGALQIAFGDYLAGMGGLMGATALIAVFTVRGAALNLPGWRWSRPRRDRSDRTSVRMSLKVRGGEMPKSLPLPLLALRRWRDALLRHLPESGP